MDTHYRRIQALSPAARQQVDQRCGDWLAAQPAADAERPTTPGTGLGARSLAVFYVADEALPAQEVRAFLEARLPAYVLPAAYVQVDALPKTINGKVDRGALRQLRDLPDARDGGEVPAGAAPSTDAEARMTGIWRAILNVRDIGVDDNFFTLGGHSLLATQVIMEIEQVFARHVPLNTIFKHPTIAQLCRHLEAEQPSRGTAAVVDEAPAEEEPPLSHAQRRLWYASQLSDGGLDYKIVKVLEMRGRLNAAALEQAMGEVVRRHESLRTVFGYASGTLVQKVQPAAPVAMAHVDFSSLPEAEADAAYARVEADVLARPFDLEQGPVLRLTLVHYAHDRARVLFDVHHIAIDGWSFAILVRELNQLFLRMASGQPGDLAPLPAQYRHYVRWEQASIKPAAQDRHLAYWRRRLEGAPRLMFEGARTDAPPDTPDGEMGFELGRERSAGIRALCAAMAQTPFTVLASVYCAMLHAHSGARDLSIGTDIANRDTKEYAALIGFFVNQLVLRVQLTPEMTFAELCQRTRACVEEAFEHKDVPYDAVVRALRPRAARARDPLFRAKLVLHQQMPDLAIDGIATTMVDARPRMTKFDLLLNLEDRPQGLIGKFEYRGAIFDAAAIERLILHFTEICEQVGRDPQVSLSALVARLAAVDRERGRTAREELRAERRQQLRALLGGGPA